MNLSLFLFLIGILGFILNRKNIIFMIISIEIMLLAVTLLVLLNAFSFDDLKLLRELVQININEVLNWVITFKSYITEQLDRISIPVLNVATNENNNIFLYGFFSL